MFGFESVYPDLYKALAHPHFALYLAGGVRDLEFLVYADTYDDSYIHSVKIISHTASLRKLKIISTSDASLHVRQCA
jgi:hypothetical protein